MTRISNNTFTFTEEQAMLLDVAQSFCADKSPISAVREQLETETGFDSDVWNEMVELGWTGIALPELVGGSELGAATVIPVLEAMGRSMLGTPLISTTLAGQLIARAGNVAEHTAVLSDIAAGKIATVALLENNDWGDERITHSVSEDGTLKGEKRFVTDAAVAEIFVVVTTQNGQPALAIVRASELPDGAVSSNTLIDQSKRSASVDFTGAKAEAVISGNKVPAALRDHRLLGALFAASEATGSAAACLDTITDYLKTRKQFGRYIGAYQSLKHPTVEILNQLNSARSFIYHAASLLTDEGLDEEAEIACRMAKAQATDTLCFAGDRAVQFHGGMGFTYECDASLFIRRAQWSQQQFGDAIHHRKRLARLLLD